MDIKDELKSRRQELGLTLKDVSDEVGVSEGTISRWALTGGDKTRHSAPKCLLYVVFH